MSQCQWRRGNWWSGHGKPTDLGMTLHLELSEEISDFLAALGSPTLAWQSQNLEMIVPIQDECTEFIHWNWEHGRDLLLIFWSQFSEITLEFQSTDFINYLQAIESAARKISRLIILPTDFNGWLWRPRVLESVFAVCFISANLRVCMVKVQTVIPSWVLNREGFVCLFAFISPLLCF